MYGLQKAAEGWEKDYTNVLGKMGFQRGRASPCVFVHPERQVYLTVYGDDFSARGRKLDLDWYETRTQEVFELTLKGRLGHAKEDHHELCILSWVLRTCSRGVEYEADPRHAEEMIRSMDLEECNSVSTPATKETVDSIANDGPLLKEAETSFRAAAARSNNLSIDRPDCQFASKEICRLMTTPTRRGHASLKRLCRYLVARPRLVHVFDFKRHRAFMCTRTQIGQDAPARERALQVAS